MRAEVCSQHHQGSQSVHDVAEFANLLECWEVKLRFPNIIREAGAACDVAEVFPTSSGKITRDYRGIDFLYRSFPNFFREDLTQINSQRSEILLYQIILG